MSSLFARVACGLLVTLLGVVILGGHWLDRRSAKRARVAAVTMELLRAQIQPQQEGLGRILHGIETSVAELDRQASYLRDELAALSYASGRSLDPASIIIGPRDTYERLDANWKSNADTSNKIGVACIEGNTGRTLVIVTLVQSNSANHGEGHYVPKLQVDNFNLYDGKCYKAVEPLLGPSGEGGNFATRLGDMLIERRLADRIILAPIGMGGTSVEQWAYEGLFNRRILALIRRLYDAGLSPDYILWHQGEGNLGNGDYGGRQYRKNLFEVVASFRSYGIKAPFFVAQATFCGGEHANKVNIRAGQRAAVNTHLAIYAGPDTDLIGREHRYDLCHMSEGGLALHASAWANILYEFAERALPSSGKAHAR